MTMFFAILLAALGGLILWNATSGRGRGSTNRRAPSYVDREAAASAFRAMERTASQRDQWVLRAQPGWTAELERRLRRSRRVAARLYFDQAELQYRRFMSAALEASPESLPEALVAQSMRFRGLIALARLQLSLPSALQPGTLLLRAATAAADEMVDVLSGARLNLERPRHAGGAVG